MNLNKQFFFSPLTYRTRYRFLILTLFMFFISGSVFTQETLCGDGLDNDGDGLYDCADTDCSASCPDAFQCESAFFQRIGDSFYELDIMTGNYTLVTNTNNLLIDKLHGGYNVRDGYMYGMPQGAGSSFRLYRIDRTNGAVWVDGSCTLTGPLGFSGVAGDMDYDNNLYKLDVPGTTPAIDYLTQVNVSTCTSVTRQFPTTLAAKIADIAFISNLSTATEKVFYGIAEDQKLYKITWGASDATWTVLVDYSSITMSTESYGAVWYDSPNNTFYASQNNTGKIYKVDVDAPATFTLVQTGQATDSNDGFNCSLAAAPFALPIELISFTADVTGCTVDLKWITASEENTSHFEIQKSVDGKEWEAEHRIEAAINSYTNKAYNFVAPLQKRQTTYFRLKMVDLDGSFTYSPTRTAICKEDRNDTFIVYPNPTKDLLTISSVAEGSLVKLMRIDGIVCKSDYVVSNEVEFDLSYLPSGIYILQVETGNQTSYFRKITKK